MSSAAVQPEVNVAMAPVRPDPNGIIVPRGHGDILITPSYARLTEALAARPAPAARWNFGVPVEEVRSVARRETLAAAAAHAAEIEAPAPANVAALPWVVTGHQVEFYHAGVWAKVVATDWLAKKAGAAAFDILVDHDVVEHLGFDVPEHRGGAPTRELISFNADVPVTPTQYIAAPDAAALRAFREAVRRWPAGRVDALDLFFDNLEKNGRGDYVAWLSAARGALERALDINVLHVPFSRIVGGLAWRHFVAVWIQQAVAYSGCYNDCLADYRRAQRIKNPSRPMPDLVRTATQVELPFWIFGAKEPRSRLVVRTGRSAHLFHNNERIDLTPVTQRQGWAAAEALGEILTRHGVDIRPRALTLTMFIRMFISDVFIHGIGGALYDQITDAFMHQQFSAHGAYGLVSAAWLLPLGDHTLPTGDLSALRWQWHHLQHNPQLAPDAAPGPEAARLLARRLNLIEQLHTSLQNHRRDPAARRQRRIDYRALHEINDTLNALRPRPLATIETQLNRLRALQRDQKIVNNREWFFALHTMASLRDLVRRVRGAE